MLSARWAHRALVGVCILVAIAVGIYAGWEGWLGPEAHKRIRGIIDPLFTQIPHSEFLERLARVLGALGTLMTAAFGVYKGIYYADRNLPERLMQLLERTDQRLLGDRQPLLAAVAESRPGFRARPSVFYVAPLNRALDAMRFGNYRAAETALNQALREIKEQMDVAGRQQRSFEEQKVAAHILRGSIASARAEYNTYDGKSPDADRALAEHEFSQALDLRPKDLDALELRGRQRALRGNHDGALGDFDALAASAKTASNPLRRARAYRLQGELLEGQVAPKSLAEARRRLHSGLITLDTMGSLRDAELLEKGRLHLAYGRVQRSRQMLPSARRHLEDAIGCLLSSRTARPKASWSRHVPLRPRSAHHLQRALLYRTRTPAGSTDCLAKSPTPTPMHGRPRRPLPPPLTR